MRQGSPRRRTTSPAASKSAITPGRTSSLSSIADSRKLITALCPPRGRRSLSRPFAPERDLCRTPLVLEGVAALHPLRRESQSLPRTRSGVRPSPAETGEQLCCGVNLRKETPIFTLSEGRGRFGRLRPKSGEGSSGQPTLRRPQRPVRSHYSLLSAHSSPSPEGSSGHPPSGYAKVSPEVHIAVESLVHRAHGAQKFVTDPSGRMV